LRPLTSAFRYRANGSAELKNSACMVFCIAGMAQTHPHVRGDVLHATTKPLTPEDVLVEYFVLCYLQTHFLLNSILFYPIATDTMHFAVTLILN
jgi:hypothetical protein